ncbi:MAG: energy transducer TonB, partial [Saprospiraceae bacterium]
KGASWKLLLTLPLLLIALWACNQDSDMTGQRLLDVEPQEPLAADAGQPAMETRMDTIVTTDPETGKETYEMVPSEVWKVAEIMPVYGDCQGSAAEVRKCSDKNMLDYVYANITYPKVAQEEGIEGVAVVSFIIPKEGGAPYNIKTARSLVGSTGERSAGTDAIDAEVLRLVREMPAKWKPGREDGLAVNVHYNLPIRFKME